MPTLTDDFVFSQSSLADWEKCRRLFLYRHIERRAHPAPETNDMLAHEEQMERGARFHQAVHQYLSGVPEDVLEKRIQEEPLTSWWRAFLAQGLQGLPPQRYAETYLSAPLGTHRLVAKYDLIAADPNAGRIVIVDWKTAERRPPSGSLQARLQTVVYRYLMVQAGAYYLDWAPVEPEQVEMVYWFPNFPEQPERLPYTHEQYTRDAEKLAALAVEIEQTDDFPKLPEAQKVTACRYCIYRNLCWNDVAAGPLAEMEIDDEPPDLAFELDLDQIAEIEF